MASVNRTTMEVGCPKCETIISASVPRGTTIDATASDSRSQLRGTETECRSCGHELEVYFY
ncbi:hypothetical protein [Halostagnicola kamekurae]|uniref:Uncharacterized protein n=1 Tax=Halostagnicola kamekurae TaxID=619731 RepID=A0A1I6U500_9EURY|nr:hypothetical protein SAMN04488556_3559 [Halostagnicola kamekurae]